jgi:DNA-binding transcriptional LysR family regulator
MAMSAHDLKCRIGSGSIAADYRARLVVDIPNRGKRLTHDAGDEHPIGCVARRYLGYTARLRSAGSGIVGRRFAMEMHHIRYFLAVARELNFTRAAERCNVSQPALTRAIQQLEDELGGQLLRREGKLSHLTDLGERMLPLMSRCLESALAAKSLATSFKAGSSQALLLALSHTIDMAPLAECLAEMQRTCRNLEFKILRGTESEIGEYLKKGQAELAVAGPLGQTWDRLDQHPLYEEKLALVLSPRHRLAGREAVDVQELAKERVLLSSACELAAGIARQLEEHGIPAANLLQAGSRHDLATLIDANLGVGFLPPGALGHKALAHVSINGLEARRQITLYTVAGRQRSIAAEALIKLLRTRDWSVESS